MENSRKHKIGKTVGLILSVLLLLGQSGCTKKKADSLYLDPQAWAERYTVTDYQENEEILEDYDESLAAHCVNGTFVGLSDEQLNIIHWKGIPFAEIPGRFERSVASPASDKVYQAYYYGPSCLQAVDESELASYYRQSDSDCLSLSVCTGDDGAKKKPVLVYIHGGGWVNGGNADPTYDSSLLCYYHPEIVVVNIQYRLDFIGMINLELFDDKSNRLFIDYDEKFKTATNNGTLDQIEALRWIKANIAAFGGDPDNVTICGESAGCGAVYNLLTILSDPNNPYLLKSENLFQKVIAMSGGINQGITLENSEALTRKLLQDFPNVASIQDLQELSAEKLFRWRAANIMYTNNFILDGEVFPYDLYGSFCKNVDPDITILTGATTNEFAYYQLVLKDVIVANPRYSFDNICRSIYELVCGQGEGKYAFEVSEAFLQARDDYFAALSAQGITDQNEQLRQFVNDVTLQGFNYYLAQKQAQRHGEVYTYSFDIPYDGEAADLKAAHAVDCFYTFGNFDGESATGNETEVELSRQWQDVLVSFMKNGKPSIGKGNWKSYDKNHTTVVIGTEGLEIVSDWQAERYEAFFKMVDSNAMMRYVTPWNDIFAHIDTFIE